MSSQLVRDVTGGTFKWMVFCPACKCGHGLDSRWTFNGNYDKPTFSPSLLIQGHLGSDKYGTCHSFIRDGMIQFCSDSTHELSGKTVPLDTI